MAKMLVLALDAKGIDSRRDLSYQDLEGHQRLGCAVCQSGSGARPDSKAMKTIILTPEAKHSARRGRSGDMAALTRTAGTARKRQMKYPVIEIDKTWPGRTCRAISARQAF